MALNDAATLVIGSGNYLTAAVDTPLPTDLTAPEADWENVGHTSLEDILGITSEGGDKTVLGTLQNKSLRTTYSDRTETLSFTLQQWDKAGLKLYFGSNAIENADGTLGIPQNPVPTTCAFLAVFIDQDNVFALYAPKAQILRGEDVDLSGTDNLAGLPLSVTPLVSGSNGYAYAVTPLGEVTP